MRYTLHLILTIAVLLTETVPGAPQRKPNQALRFASARSAKIPFELVGNFIVLRARVNDSGPFSFLLDTGATASYFDAQLAKSSGLTQDNSISHASLSLPGVTVLGQNFLLRPLGFGIYSGHAMDGLLGYDFISRFVIDIDYVKRTLTLSSPESYRYFGRGQVLPLNMLEDDSGGKVPLVRVLITQQGRASIEGNFIADTGVRGAISFNTPFVEAKQLLQFAGKTLHAPLGGGAQVRESKQPLGRIGNVQLGKFGLKNHIGTFFQNKQGIVASRDFDGVIGAEILSRFRAIFDYSRQRLIIEPNPFFRAPEEFDMSGMLLVAEGTDFKTFKVKQIIEGSSAAVAGLREGDLISSVNGRPASTLTLEPLRKMFKQNGRSYTLGIARGEQRLSVTVKLKRLI